MASIGTAVAVACLCVGIFMQLLGVPTTLWELALDLDPCETASPEGFTVLPTVPNLFSFDMGPRVEDVPKHFASRMFDQSVFRPPCPIT
jgi:hypothetical protein